MTFHATNLEQFMLRRGMEREIERQKSLPPRWSGRMIFRQPAAAAAFVARLHQAEAGMDEGQVWTHVRDIIALSHELYSSEEEARCAALAVRSILGFGEKPEMPENLVVSGDLEMISITVSTSDEPVSWHFLWLEDHYVPVSE